MHVAHVYDGHERVASGQGSVPDVVWSLARRTAAVGHRVTVVERRWNGLDATEERDGVRFERFSLRTGSSEPWTDIPYEMATEPTGLLRLALDRTNFALAARRRLRGLDADVLHVHLPFAANVLATLVPSLRERLVYTAHIGETEKRVVNARVSPDVLLAKRAARTIVLNPAMREAFEERGVPTRKLATIPNGVDLDRFSSTDSALDDRLRSTYDLSDAPLALFVGTITPRKGVLELVEAAARVAEAGHEVQFVLVGKDDIEPGYTKRVRAAIAERGIEERVTFTGFVPEEELRGLYRLADVFVLPSFEEGSSIAVAEAMAAGLPVVASAISGVEQQVSHGRHGLLAEPGDSVELAAHLERLIANLDERAAMAAAVAERRADLSWERVTEAVIECYREVLRQ